MFCIRIFKTWEHCSNHFILGGLQDVTTKDRSTMWDRISPPEMAVTPVSVNLVDVSPAPTTHAVSYFILTCVWFKLFFSRKTYSKKKMKKIIRKQEKSCNDPIEFCWCMEAWYKKIIVILIHNQSIYFFVYTSLYIQRSEIQRRTVISRWRWLQHLYLWIRWSGGLYIEILSS